MKNETTMNTNREETTMRETTREKCQECGEMKSGGSIMGNGMFTCTDCDERREARLSSSIPTTTVLGAMIVKGSSRPAFGSQEDYRETGELAKQVIEKIVEAVDLMNDYRARSPQLSKETLVALVEATKAGWKIDDTMFRLARECGVPVEVEFTGGPEDHEHNGPIPDEEQILPDGYDSFDSYIDGLIDVATTPID